MDETPELLYLVIFDRKSDCDRQLEINLRTLNNSPAQVKTVEDDEATAQQGSIRQKTTLITGWFFSPTGDFLARKNDIWSEMERVKHLVAT